MQTSVVIDAQGNECQIKSTGHVKELIDYAYFSFELLRVIPNSWFLP